MDVTDQILVAGYLGFDPEDYAGRLVKVHPDIMSACRNTQAGGRVFYLQGTLAELLEAGMVMEVVE